MLVTTPATYECRLDDNEREVLRNCSNTLHEIAHTLVEYHCYNFINEDLGIDIDEMRLHDAIDLLEDLSKVEEMA